MRVVIVVLLLAATVRAAGLTGLGRDSRLYAQDVTERDAMAIYKGNYAKCSRCFFVDQDSGGTTADDEPVDVAPCIDSLTHIDTWSRSILTVASSRYNSYVIQNYHLPFIGDVEGPRNWAGDEYWGFNFITRTRRMHVCTNGRIGLTGELPGFIYWHPPTPTEKVKNLFSLVRRLHFVHQFAPYKASHYDIYVDSSNSTRAITSQLAVVGANIYGTPVANVPSINPHGYCYVVRTGWAGYNEDPDNPETDPFLADGESIPVVRDAFGAGGVEPPGYSNAYPVPAGLWTDGWAAGAATDEELKAVNITDALTATHNPSACAHRPAAPANVVMKAVSVYRLSDGVTPRLVPANDEPPEAFTPEVTGQYHRARLQDNDASVFSYYRLRDPVHIPLDTDAPLTPTPFHQAVSTADVTGVKGSFYISAQSGSKCRDCNSTTRDTCLTDRGNGFVPVVGAVTPCDHNYGFDCYARGGIGGTNELWGYSICEFKSSRAEQLANEDNARISQTPWRDGDDTEMPDNANNFTHHKARMWCLPYCHNATLAGGSCASHTGGLPPSCRNGARPTPSGRCVCAGGNPAQPRTHIGPGCDVALNKTQWNTTKTTWDAYLDELVNSYGSDKTAAGDEICKRHGSLFCSGNGWCKSDTHAPAWPFRCSCAEGWFGSPGVWGHRSVYASDQEPICRTVRDDAYETTSTHDKGSALIQGVTTNWTIAKGDRWIALQQCLYYVGERENSMRGQFGDDPTPVAGETPDIPDRSSAIYWRGASSLAIPQMALTPQPLLKAVHGRPATFHCADFRPATDRSKLTLARVNPDYAGVLFGGIGCRPVYPQTCNIPSPISSVPSPGGVAYAHRPSKSFGLSACMCELAEVWDPVFGCVQRLCPANGNHNDNVCSRHLGQGHCPWHASALRPDMNNPDAVIATPRMPVVNWTSSLPGSPVKYSYQCACEPGFGGARGDCSERIVPFARDPVCLHNASTASDCPEVPCGGHGTPMRRPGVDPAAHPMHNITSDYMECRCDQEWRAWTPEIAHIYNAPNAESGSCVAGMCRTNGDLECSGLVRSAERKGHGSLPAAAGLSVCDMRPPLPNTAGPRCQCFEAVTHAAGVLQNADSLNATRWGDTCQHTFLSQCVDGTGSICSNGNGYCLGCRDQFATAAKFKQQPVRDCSPQRNVPPTCICKSLAVDHAFIPLFAGDHCERDLCNDGNGCNTAGTDARQPCMNTGTNGLICNCINNHAGKACEIDLTGDGICVGAEDASVCSGHRDACVRCIDNPNDPSNLCGQNLTDHWCGDCPSWTRGSHCEINVGCGLGCEGRCQFGSTAETSTCWCGTSWSSKTYTGTGGTCGDDVCTSTGGRHSVAGAHSSCDCGDPDLYVMEPHVGCRLLCPVDAEGRECGGLQLDGSSRCALVLKNASDTNQTLPECSCSPPGDTPLHQARRFVAVPAVGDIANRTICQRHCLHCWDNGDSCIAGSCDPVDQVDGVCQYSSEDDCTVKTCGDHGIRLADSSCRCTSPTRAGDTCDVDKCAPGGQPDIADGGRTCYCLHPYRAHGSARDSCESVCINGGVPNTELGYCTGCLETWGGDLCHTSLCEPNRRPRVGDTACGDCPHALFGDTCSNSSCLHGGAPREDGSSCVCEGIWDGPLCEHDRCGVHGSPQLPTGGEPGTEVCNCDAGWEVYDGLSCDRSACGPGVLPVHCGDTDQNQPACDLPDYQFNCDCGVAAERNPSTGACVPVPQPCSGHGRVSGEHCVCDTGYSGTRCDDWVCDPYTGAHVRAEARVMESNSTGVVACRCRPPWTGTLNTTHPSVTCIEHGCGMGVPVPIDTAPKDGRDLYTNRTADSRNTTTYDTALFHINETSKQCIDTDYFALRHQPVHDNDYPLTFRMAKPSGNTFRGTSFCQPVHRDTEWMCTCADQGSMNAGITLNSGVEGVPIHPCQLVCKTNHTDTAKSNATRCACKPEYAGAACMYVRLRRNTTTGTRTGGDTSSTDLVVDIFEYGGMAVGVIVFLIGFRWLYYWRKRTASGYSNP